MRSATPSTLGVEEEFVLLDADTGLPAPRIGAVRAAARHGPVLGGDEVDNELLQALVEVATPVCTGLDEVTGQLFRLRQALTEAASACGCRLAASGAAPLAARVEVPVTGGRRYREMRADAGQLVGEQLIAGMHVHVGVPDRGAAAAALGQLRPWLPVLIALGANSPYWQGGDTGYASWRTVVFGRWPVSGPPPFTADAAGYDRRVRALLATGVIPDRHQLYWHARLSEDYPTLEVRAPDVQLDLDDAVTLAGVVRALVATGLRRARGGARPLDPPPGVLDAASWHAARHGLTGTLVDPRRGAPVPAPEVVAALLRHLTPALDELGDAERVTAGVRRILDAGTGAARQRAAFAAAGADGLLDLIAPLPQPPH
ncbi:carboxylate-amine ligase [Streptomyces sp. NRRL F-5123]|uniref:carboxylate-amine ligase n=1 Tax=Streptomyces sp. NRRL F-5123 TaxID=1463856 RepID=UPI0004E12168|nr:glutamate--cysteine ligase [Streptomyces sp. NRRL F-5123]